MYSISHLTRNSLTMLRTSVGDIFVYAPKNDNLAIVSLHAFWGNVYPFTMPGSPEELMTSEKLISRELHQKLPTYGHVAKYF